MTVTITDTIASGATAAADWIIHDPSTNPPDARLVYLELDPSRRVAFIDTEPRDTAWTTDAVRRRLRIRWYVPDGTDAAAAWRIITGADAAADLAAVCDGWDEARDARDLHPVGTLTDAAEEAEDRLDRMFRELPYMENGGIIEAGDWLRDADLDVTAASTDDDLDRVADEIDAEARGEGYVVVGTRLHLHDLRADLRRP